MLYAEGLTRMRHVKQAARLPVRAARYAARSIYGVQHSLAECVRRMPPVWNTTPAASTESVLEAVNTLRERGVLIVPDFISTTRLDQLRDDFDEMVDRIRSTPASEKRCTRRLKHFGRHEYMVDAHCDVKQMTQTRDPYKYSPLFLDLALNSFIREVGELYFGRTIALQNSDCRRLYPMPPQDFGFFDWHHDARGRKLNAMFLLTDLTKTDQRLTYLTGSQGMIHSLQRCLRNSYSRQEIDRRLTANPSWELVECTGPAGSLVLFDANGLHRGNRNQGAVRDTFMTRFMSDVRHCWPQRIPKSDFDQLSTTDQQFLLRNKSTTVE